MIDYKACDTAVKLLVSQTVQMRDGEQTVLNQIEPELRKIRDSIRKFKQSQS